MSYICTICTDFLSDIAESRPAVTPCGHVFHRSCLFTWIALSRTCPICKKSCHREKVISSIYFSSTDETDVTCADTLKTMLHSANLAKKDKEDALRESRITVLYLDKELQQCQALLAKERAFHIQLIKTIETERDKTLSELKISKNLYTNLKGQNSKLQISISTMQFESNAKTQEINQSKTLLLESESKLREISKLKQEIEQLKKSVAAAAPSPSASSSTSIPLSTTTTAQLSTICSSTSSTPKFELPTLLLSGFESSLQVETGTNQPKLVPTSLTQMTSSQKTVSPSQSSLVLQPTTANNTQIVNPTIIQAPKPSLQQPMRPQTPTVKPSLFKQPEGNQSDLFGQTRFVVKSNKLVLDLLSEFNQLQVSEGSSQQASLRNATSPQVKNTLREANLQNNPALAPSPFQQLMQQNNSSALQKTFQFTGKFELKPASPNGKQSNRTAQQQADPAFSFANMNNTLVENPVSQPRLNRTRVGPRTKRKFNL